MTDETRAHLVKLPYGPNSFTEEEVRAAISTRRDGVNIARRRIAQGNKWPYEAPDDWYEGDGSIPAAPKDWYVAAVRGIIADLEDRRDIKRGFEGVDEDVRAEIVESLAEIIRQAVIVQHRANTKKHLCEFFGRETNNGAECPAGCYFPNCCPTKLDEGNIWIKVDHDA